MIKWLNKLFGICSHKWKTEQTYDIFTITLYPDLNNKEYKLKTGVCYILICTECGKRKSQKIRL